MIEKERLEELIKQVATVYCVDNNKVYDIALLNNADNINTATKYGLFTQWRERNKANPIGWWKQDSYGEENLFENKEDAEFALRYKRIPKTEYLDLPTWEEFNSEDKLVAFTVYPHNYHLLKVGNYIYLRSFYGQGGMDIFNKPLTKENYIDACRLCKKLFLGEKE